MERPPGIQKPTFRTSPLLVYPPQPWDDPGAAVITLPVQLVAMLDTRMDAKILGEGAAAYLRAKDEAGYQRWKRTEEAECRRAGLQ